MKHFASPSFWEHYHELPEAIQKLADKNFELLKADPRHPSLHFKKVDRFWSARVGRDYRTLAAECPEGFIWFWIGSHADYDQVLSSR